MRHLPPRLRATLPVLLVACVILAAAPARSRAQNEAPAAGDTLLLTAREPETKAPDSDGGLLIREILRQAVLQAAREELGLATRDAALREFTPAADRPAGLLEVRTAVVGQKVTIVLERGSAVVWQKELVQPLKELNLLALAAEMEWRAREELPHVLRRAGFKAATKPAGKPAAVPA